MDGHLWPPERSLLSAYRGLERHRDDRVWRILGPRGRPLQPSDELLDPNVSWRERAVSSHRPQRRLDGYRDDRVGRNGRQHRWAIQPIDGLLDSNVYRPER